MIKKIIDLSKNADNIYRTKFYIIKQVLSLETNFNGQTNIHSDDFYYLRNKKLDLDYEKKFCNRLIINGKRIHTATHTKHYM